jgi:hypothetical protein
MPVLVTFSDVGDPKSGRLVMPDEFERIYGSGVRLERILVEMVPAGIWPFSAFDWPPSFAGEPVTRGIEKKLPWWRGEGRPAQEFYRASRVGQVIPPSTSGAPETFFKRN